jgi:(1->4)-alpha-D-glucan 1-alpha-D-glucosylmutase
VAGDGSEAWANQGSYALGMNVGAPPDEFNPRGQDWGLPPLSPRRLRESAYAPFIATLRANMSRAGALRIDHVMGLERLYWIPRDAPAAEGAYVRYPIEDLLGIVALESHRHRCMVIGEDLGTVADSFREKVASAGVLTYRVMPFEREGERFKRPAAYPRQALVSWSTHDLPTFAGWWQDEDLRTRAELGLLTPEELANQGAPADARSPGRSARARGTRPYRAMAAGAVPREDTACVMVVQMEDVFGVVP